eukprot:tig00021517_g21997.t1
MTSSSRSAPDARACPTGTRERPIARTLGSSPPSILRARTARRNDAAALFTSLGVAFIALLALAAVASAGPTTPRTDLELELLFDSRSLADTSGKGNNGNIVGQVNVVRHGPGYALALNGAGYVEIDSTAALSVGTDDYTLYAWVNANPSNRGRILSKGSFFCSTGYMLRLSEAGRPYTEAGSGGTCLITLTGNDEVADNTWHSVAVVGRRGSGVDIYVDGLRSSTQAAGGAWRTASLANQQLGLRVGANNQGGERFVGLIDAVRIYSRQLSDAELLALHRADADSFRPPALAPPTPTPSPTPTPTPLTCSSLTSCAACVSAGCSGWCVATNSCGAADACPNPAATGIQCANKAASECPASPDLGVYPAQCQRGSAGPCRGQYPDAQSRYPNAAGSYPDSKGCYPDAQGRYVDACNRYPNAQGMYPSGSCP